MSKFKTGDKVKLEINITAETSQKDREFLEKAYQDLKKLKAPFTPEQTEKIKEMVLESLAPIAAENIAYKAMCDNLKKELDELIRKAQAK